MLLVVIVLVGQLFACQRRYTGAPLQSSDASLVRADCPELFCIGETGFLGPETERPKSPYGRGPFHQTLGDCLQANSRECWFRMGSTEEAASVAGRPAG